MSQPADLPAPTPPAGMASATDRDRATPGGAGPRRGDSFRRGVLSVGGGSMVSLVVLFAESVIVARMLPIPEMGAYAFFQATLSLLIIAVDLGFRTTAAQFISGEVGPDQRARVTHSLLLVRLIVLALLAGPIFGLGQLLPDRLGMPGLRGLMVAMPLVLALASLDELATGMLQGFQRYKQLAFAQVLRSVLRLAISAFLLLVLRRGLGSLALSWALSFGASAAWQYFALPVKHRLAVDWGLVRRALRFGAPLQLTRYLWFGMQQAETFILTALVGPVGVAFYNVAGRLPQGLQRLQEAYSAVYHPSLATRFARHDGAGATRLIERSLRLFDTLTLFAAWGAALFGRDVIVAVFGDRYAPAAPAFTIMLFTFSLSSAVNLMGYALTAYGQPSRSFAINLVRAATGLSTAFLLIPIFDFMGAAYANLLAQVAALPLAWWYLRRDELPVFGSIHARHLALMGVLGAAYVALPSLGFGPRLVLLALFAPLALALTLVAPGDLAAVLPAGMRPRAWLAARVAGHPGGSEQ